MIGLTLQETYRHISLAWHADLSFDLSFDKAILKNLGCWLGLQTLGRGIPVSSEGLPLWDIVVTAFHRGSEDLLFAIPFAWLVPVAWPSCPAPLVLETFCLC